jgi:hypothetical protein
LSPDDQAVVQKKIDNRTDIVPVEIKQRWIFLFRIYVVPKLAGWPAVCRRAMKMGGQAIANAAKKNWTDMGLYTLTFYGYTKANGKITVSTCVIFFRYIKYL